MNFYLSFLAYNCWRIIITAVIAYLLGSVNTAVIVTKIVTGGKKDIREMGSGNAGFTNVLRSVGKVPAIFTIVCDALKCVVAVIIGWLIFGVFLSLFCPSALDSLSCSPVIIESCLKFYKFKF